MLILVALAFTLGLLAAIWGCAYHAARGLERIELVLRDISARLPVEPEEDLDDFADLDAEPEPPHWSERPPCQN